MRWNLDLYLPRFHAELFYSTKSLDRFIKIVSLKFSICKWIYTNWIFTAFAKFLLAILLIQLHFLFILFGLILTLLTFISLDSLNYVSKIPKMYIFIRHTFCVFLLNWQTKMHISIRHIFCENFMKKKNFRHECSSIMYKNTQRKP